MLLGIIIIVGLVAVFIFAVVWLVKTESKLDSLQTKKLEELRNQLKLQYCDDWFPLVYGADRPHYGRSLPAPFRIRKVLTIDISKGTFELYTVMAKGENVHKSIQFSAASIELPTDLKDLRLGLSVKGLDFISPKFVRPGEPITANIQPQPSDALIEVSEAIGRIIAA